MSPGKRHLPIDVRSNKKRDGAKVFKEFTELHFGVLFAQQAIASAQTGNSCWLVAGYTTNFHGYLLLQPSQCKSARAATLTFVVDSTKKTVVNVLPSQNALCFITDLIY